MLKKEIGRLKRHRRIRKKVSGSGDKPRVSVHRSAKNLYVQVINDEVGTTLVGMSTQQISNGTKQEQAKQLGQELGKKMIESGIKKVAFDRGGYLYHGRVKYLADALREAGVQL